jgi:predicted dehydrogenase
MDKKVTRRDVLRIAAAGSTIAGSIATGRARSAARVVGANGKINTAVIGVGGRGSYLLQRALHRAQEKNDVAIVALCDVYQHRLTAAQEAARKQGHDPKTYTLHQELLQRTDLDAVMIATPDHWHAPITLAAFDRGLDVYCEKPMTHTVEEAEVVAAKAREKQRVMQIGVQALSWRRWHKIKEIIAAGTIGQVVAVQGTYSRNDTHGDWNWPINAAAGPNATGEDHIDWNQWLGSAPQRAFDADRFFRFRKYWDYSGGIATDLHYHIVAPFHLAVENAHPSRVAGMGGLWVYNDGREVPDTFLTAADYPGKWSMTVQSSQVNEIGPTMMLRGTMATIHLGDEWEGPQGRNTSFARIVAETPYRDEFRKKNGTDELIIENVGNDTDQPHVDNFFDCVHSREQPNCNADLGWKVMTAIDLSVRSYRQNRVFVVNPATGRTEKS